MKILIRLGLVICLMNIAVSAQAEVRTCTAKDSKAADNDAGWNRADDNALFSIPPIVYNRPKVAVLGTELLLVVNGEGQIVCMKDENNFVRAMMAETSERQAIMDQIASWRFKPYLDDKQKPVTTLVNIYIPEKVDFNFHEDMPTAPLSEVTIKLSRTGCYGSCPGYSVTIKGTGWGEFKGGEYTAMRGKYVYALDPKRLEALLESFREKDVWSMSGNWVGNGFDAPRYDLEITIGDQTRHIADYFGDDLGMPRAVTEAMDAVDEASRANDMIHLSGFAVSVLEKEGMDFRSQKAADLFLSAVNDPDLEDDSGLLRMIELGVSLTRGKANEEEYRSKETVLNAALSNHHSRLIKPLLAKGLLNTAGRADQAKVEAAFRAAIRGGRLEAVQLIWEQAAARPHPSLTFDDRDEDGKVTKQSPVTLLLRNPEYDEDKAWEGLEIAKWLIALGCDVNARGADGTTLLEIAAEADDIALAKYLISVGADASLKGKSGSTALGSVTRDEDMAMLLIENGANPWDLESEDYSFIRFARDNKWLRVLEWMDAHKPKKD